MGIGEVEKSAVFLDRDGVINELVLNPTTGEYESPHDVKDLVIYRYAFESLLKLQEKGYLLFLVTNQPSYAKGKTSLESLKDIHDSFHEQMVSRGVEFTEYYYCYHHPDGKVPGLTGVCKCRKPGTLFIEQAFKKFKISRESSWMVGDRATDVMCGKNAGINTILVKNEHSRSRAEGARADYRAEDLSNAVKIIINVSKVWVK